MNITIETGVGTDIPVRTLQFPGGERHAQIDVSALERATSFVIRARLWSSDDIFDLLLITDALQRARPETPIDVEIPYLPYARQDRVASPGQAFSLDVIARILNGAQFRRIVIWDCHSRVGTQCLQPSRAESIDPVTIIRSSDALDAIIRNDASVLICPDKGAMSRTRAIAGSFADKRIVHCEKIRDPATGKISHTEVYGDDLAGSVAVITDDICDGGYTFVKIAEQLKALNTDRIILYVTHGIFSKGLEVFDGLIDEVFTTDSHFRPAIEEKLTIIPYRHEFFIKETCDAP